MPYASAVAIAYRNRTNVVIKVYKVNNPKLGWQVKSSTWSDPIQVKYWNGIRQIQIGTSKTRWFGPYIQEITSVYKYIGY